MKTSLFRRLLPPRSLSSRSIRLGYFIHRPFIRYNSSLTPKNDVPPPSKWSHSIFSDLGNPEASKPMFEQLALLTPVLIPEDPEGVIRVGDSAAELLDHSALVMERRLEMLNVFLVTPIPRNVLMEGI